MAHYNVSITQPIIINTSVVVDKITSYEIFFTILVLLVFLTLFFIFQHFLIKFLEGLTSKNKNWWHFIISLISLIFLVLVSFEFAGIIHNYFIG